jgi:hypothetical protein
MIMVKDQQKILKLTKWVSSLLLIIGFSVFISHLFTSALTSEYLLMAGIGVMVASVFLFIGGSFLSSLEDVSQQPSSY